MKSLLDRCSRDLPACLQLMHRWATRTRCISYFHSSMASPPPDKKQKLESDDHLHSYRNEADVGITEHANDHPGFFGVLKARYSDFLVHEISRDKKVVQLTDLSTLPVQLVKIPSIDVISQEQQSELSGLSDSTNDQDKVLINVEGCDKERRSQIHKSIRHFYPKLSSTTITNDNDGQRCIEVMRASSANTSRSNWPQGRGDYCQFVLYKENCDTVDAVGLLARTLRVKPKSLQYAGTKDKRAITSQLITAYRVEAERLRQVNSVFKNIKIGNYQYVKEGLFLGDLTGNQFTVALRNVSAEDTVTDEAVNALKQSGFINYFGMQRFGTAAAPTHAIGKCILLEDWLGAVELILQPRKGDSEGMASVKQEWWKSRDPTAALAKGSPDKSSAALLLRGLVKHGPWKDYVNALHFIPRGTRLMYVHSYQSLIWNKVASRRVKEFGFKPIEGDLVKSGDEVECLTTDNVGNYSIKDIVLPLPGHSVTYPNNEVGRWYVELLEQDKLSSEKLRCRVKDYSLSGNYRPLMIKPDNVTWHSVYYDEIKAQLLETDKDKLEGESLSPPSSGAHKAVVVKFSLPSGCYATMALRELLKKDTSWAAQQSYVQQLDLPELYNNSPPASPDLTATSASPKCTTAPASAKQDDT